MTRRDRAPDPLDGVDRLLVDGTNLLYALRRGPEPRPAAALIGRIRAVVPPTADVEIVFDGPPDPGSRGRIASGVRVRYAGGRTADALLLDLVPPPQVPGEEPHVLVVTDDGELRRAMRARGARTAGAEWLIRRLDRTRLESPSAGRPRPPVAPAPGAGAVDEGDPVGGWRPGRGATRKRGNPKRSPKGSRRPG